MDDDQYMTLLGKIDGVARAFMVFIARQEEQGALDGNEYCRDLHQLAAARDRLPGLQASAGVLREIAGELDQARACRAAAHREEVRRNASADA